MLGAARRRSSARRSTRASTICARGCRGRPTSRRPRGGESRAPADVPREVRPRRGLRLRDLHARRDGGRRRHGSPHGRPGRALEIGYWVRASRVGRVSRGEATAALTAVAFRVCGVDRVEIRVDPSNAAASGSRGRSGFTEEGHAAAQAAGQPGTRRTAGRSSSPSSRTSSRHRRSQPSRWRRMTCSAAGSARSAPLQSSADVKRPRHARGLRARGRPGRLAPRAPPPQGGAGAGRPLRQGPRARDPRR